VQNASKNMRTEIKCSLVAFQFMKPSLLNASLISLFSIIALAADAPVTNPIPATPAPTTKGEWVPVLEGTGGVVADRAGGEVFAVVTGKEIFKEKGQGVWKSTDAGATFARVDGGVISGRCETGYGLCADPAGRRLYGFMLDGASGFTLDGGQTWEKLTQMHRGWDCAAVDWSVERPQTLFAVEHESGGKQFVSTDGGKSWTKVGEAPKDQPKFTFGVGVVNAKTLLRWTASAACIERSTDTGATWAKVSDELPTGHVMVVLKDTCYWVGAKGLLVSHDQGATWAWQGSVPTDVIPFPSVKTATPESLRASAAPTAWGPYFGKDEKHIVVASKDGIVETTDAGAHWAFVAPLPEPYRRPPGNGWYLNLAFDPIHNTLYTSWMGKPVYRWQR